ncbi:MAG: transketolase [Candidatus Margulisbacteria bacterium]|nr:transketolase [Candidatus Margulisiibacteriota bacterium]
MTGEKEINELVVLSRKIRGKIIELSAKAGVAHVGSALSCVDILIALYWRALKIDPKKPSDPGRDRFILSKGHAATALYAVLSERGFFGAETLALLGVEGSEITEHPGPGSAPGVEVGSGSLGHGLSLGIGMALAGRIRRLDYRIFVLMSDGEMNEGSVWEAALFAPIHKIDNLVAFIDFNRWQATGRSEEIMALEPLAKKWEAFGWNVYEINGHDFAELVDVLEKTKKKNGKPTIIIAKTVKGKGVSFMEDDNNWHYKIPDQTEVDKALKELGLK